MQFADLWRQYGLPVLLGAAGNAVWFVIQILVSAFSGQPVAQKLHGWGYLIFTIIGFVLALIWNRRVDARPAGLKRRAHELSKRIFRFLSERAVHDPSKQLFSPSTIRVGETTEQGFQRRQQDIVSYMHETMNLYDEQFAAEVVAMRDELKRNGLESPELDARYEHPTNPLGIRVVAERLGALADRLSD